jgi:hypothetical protein
MTRALSVAEGNGEQSWCASQPTSEEGRCSRGKRAACWSGAEKSRQIKQDPAAPGFGFEAMIAFRLGLEERGTGGGVPAVVSGAELNDGRFCGIGGGSVALLLKPSSSTDLRGGGAITLFVFDVVTLFVFVLPGRGGRSGELSWTFDCRGGSDGLAGSSGVLDRLGGSVWLRT